MATFTEEQRACFGYAVTRWALTKARTFTEDGYVQEYDDRPAAAARRTFRSLVRRGLFVPDAIEGSYQLSESAIWHLIHAAKRDERARQRMERDNGYGKAI